MAVLALAPAAVPAYGAEQAGVEVNRPPEPVTRVVGHGTPASCTARAFRRAVARGGTITFDCGPGAVTIRLDKTAVVRNDAAPNVVIDGGGLVTLGGAGKRRILYLNTCDPRLGITSSHCQDQSTPRLVLRGLTFSRGNSTGQKNEGGGAVFFVSNDRSGSLWIKDSELTDNPSLGFENYPGIFFLGKGEPHLNGSVVE